MLKEALEKVTKALHKLQVPYALIGGLAVTTHGVVRATKDVDLLVDWPIHEVKALAESLAYEGLPARAEKSALEDPVPGLIRVIIQGSASPITCHILFPSKTWQADAVRNAPLVELGGFAVRVVRARDLFLLKLHAGGPQDLLDAAELLRIQGSAKRRPWERSASRHGLSREYKRCLGFLKQTD